MLNDAWTKARNEHEKVQWRQMRWNLVRRYCDIPITSSSSVEPPSRPYLVSGDIPLPSSSGEYESKAEKIDHNDVSLPSMSDEMTQLIMRNFGTYHTRMRRVLCRLSMKEFQQEVRYSIEKWFSPYFASKTMRKKLKQLPRWHSH